MGAAESRPFVTPSRPYNRHLSRVADPRSPTAGILRTPIEVGDTPKRVLESLLDEEVVDLDPMVLADPRSPTHGIVRTPLRPSLHDSLNFLVKQLSEVFVSEDSGIEGSPTADGELPAISPEKNAESDPTSTPVPVMDKAKEFAVEVGETTVESPDCHSTAEATPNVQKSQKQRGKSPHGSGSKNVRQRPRKALTSATPGRSPLKILQEDNSPSTGVQNRSLKKISFQSEPLSSLRMLKISHNNWEMSYNKENTHCTQSES